ncbi:MAG: cyclic-di-AMP receptor [Eubacteriales bacterium]|nr:cyclic-di-AMP receptor [Eubacteriales bacterium]
MKLLYIIVRDDNESDVVSHLTKEGFMITKLATTGGFLKKGNTTLMSCMEDSVVEQCIGIIKKECGERKVITVDMPVSMPQAQLNFATVPTKIEIGGATIIVLDVVRFDKF